MYSKMCAQLAKDLPECSDDHGVLTFKEVSKSILPTQSAASSPKVDGPQYTF